MTFQAWLQQAIARLAESDSPRRDAEILLGHVTGRARTWILAFGETTLSADEAAKLEALLVRRQRGEPIAHLVGQREFWSLPLFVSPATLIPRPDTECLVEQALARLPTAPCRILDLGTGTGAIALALASERPDCEVTAVDVMPDAVALALRNAEHLGIANVTISQSALTALVAGDQGLADLAHIIREGRQYLQPGGWMLLEHGWTQGEAVRALFRAAGYLDVATCRDYGDNERLTLGRLPDMENVG
ncbi:protein-(glutamine-N5) methyltransferase, release factor-specific [Klebsiella pneumoniae]|nr:protein-(glutamine-N5) methyltransferase, release factor-specific [Klebsiella pneumoniae]